MTKRNSQGFTILEVLIVLAIATVIMLIVFVTVPALRRNARNESRRRDASLILTQRVQYNANMATVMRAGSFKCDPPITNKPFCQHIDGSLSYYSPSNVTFTNSGLTKPTSAPEITSPEEILTITYYKCDETATLAEISDDPKNMIVLYAIETADGILQQCRDTNVAPTVP